MWYSNFDKWAGVKKILEETQGHYIKIQHHFPYKNNFFRLTEEQKKPQMFLEENPQPAHRYKDLYKREEDLEILSQGYFEKFNVRIIDR